MPGTAELRWAINKLEQQLGQSSPNSPQILSQLRQDPATIMAMTGIPPDPWQANLLRNYNRSTTKRTLLLCSRQAGKSTVSASLALLTALLDGPSLVLLLSPSQRQSSELFRKVWETYEALERPIPAVSETVLTLQLANGSRVIALPGAEQNIRGYSGSALLVIDEAARVPDSIYKAVRPMLAVSGGSLIGLSTAWAKQGWFYEAWTGTEDWNRVKVTANQCPRISKQFLEEERLALGERWYRMEYFCEFGEGVESVFRPEDIEAAFRGGAGLQPLFH